MQIEKRGKMNNPAEGRLHCKFIKQSCYSCKQILSCITTCCISGWMDRPPQKICNSKHKHLSELVDFEN